MKRNDIKLIIILSIIALISVVTVQILQNRQSSEDGVAIITYENREILRIDLADGTSEVVFEDHVQSVDDEAGIYIVDGKLGDVEIHYDADDHTVFVEDETSPENICQKQGKTNSSLKPLTCLPNEVVIRIETPLPDPDEDDAIIY
ncbi:MAG: NusG domain II-containing protein [Bacillota bacterium]